MRVLVIPTWLPRGEDKLMGEYHKEFTNALNKNGIKADMIFIERERISKPLKYIFASKREIEREKNYDIYIYKKLDERKFGLDREIRSYTKLLDRALGEYLKTHEKPDVLHAMVTVPAGYAASVVGKKYGIPVLVTEHAGALERFFKRDDLKKYGEFVLKNATYSTVSNYMKDITLNYTDECYVLPNQVDTSLFNDIKPARKGKTFKLVMTCAIREGKRLDVAFDAISLLIDEGVDIHLDIIGDGFYEEIYKNDCKNKGLNNHVTFLGRKTKPEIAKIYKSENALLISSELESFAIPGIEALAAGLPVISTKCLGPEEYLDKKSGILCEVNDAKDMARAIKEMIKNYDKYSVPYLKSIASKFSEESVTSIAKSLYDIAIKKNNE